MEGKGERHAQCVHVSKGNDDQALNLCVKQMANSCWTTHLNPPG
jgi:hypothetical protein